jgi:hypothetical protein
MQDMRRIIKLAFSSFVLENFLIAIAMTPVEVQAETSRLQPALHARALARAQELPRLRSLLISVNGELVEERYFNGTRPS